MIKCCIFDMGGVMIRDYHMEPELMPFLGLNERSFAAVDLRFREALRLHSRGEIKEADFWSYYSEITGKAVPPHDGSLLGRFFHPTLDEPTVQTAMELKASGMRLVCGTNVIDAHYDIHIKLNQYAVFDKVYASHLIGIVKPESAFYDYMLKEEGITAAEAFFTDDMAENVETASHFGLNAFLYTGASALREQLRTFGLLL